MDSLLVAKNIGYHNDGKDILKNISLTVETGDFISITGPSGSGKSILLKLCSHLISPTSGNIAFKGRDYAEYSPADLRKIISYCFQTPYLFGSTVLDNIRFPFGIRNAQYDHELVERLFTAFHMPADFLSKEVKNLSGGEKQRIALIRSLVFTPEILLLDEITSALDADNAAIVENVILKLNQDGVTVLWVTHNPEQSRKHANKLLRIEAGEAKALEVLR